MYKPIINILIVSFNCCVFYLGIKFIPKKKKVTTEMYVIVVANSYSLGVPLLLAAQISSVGSNRLLTKSVLDNTIGLASKLKSNQINFKTTYKFIKKVQQSAVHTYTHTYIHSTYIHTHTYIPTHTYIHTYICTYMPIKGVGEKPTSVQLFSKVM